MKQKVLIAFLFCIIVVLGLSIVLIKNEDTPQVIPVLPSTVTEVTTLTTSADKQTVTKATKTTVSKTKKETTTKTKTPKTTVIKTTVATSTSSTTVTVTEITTTEKNIIELNTATYEDFLTLGITPELAESCIDLRENKIFFFTNVLELLYADGMTKSIFLSIQDYCYVDPVLALELKTQWYAARGQPLPYT
jgi:DNA uptake protein ComE-like DNA-binding protein